MHDCQATQAANLASHLLSTFLPKYRRGVAISEPPRTGVGSPEKRHEGRERLTAGESRGGLSGSPQAQAQKGNLRVIRTLLEERPGSDRSNQELTQCND